MRTALSVLSPRVGDGPLLKAGLVIRTKNLAASVQTRVMKRAARSVLSKLKALGF